ncbi:hypothetical protein PS681_04439 [Pseudomonas fluorescens]|nr:hypothetical protein PS681_04439 [Pseudomonas fluorescens]
MTVGVEVIDHRRQCGRFARASRPGDQHQPARGIGDLAEDVAHGEVFHAQHLRRNRTKHRPGATVLVKGVNPKARDTGDFEGKVGFQMFLEVDTLGVVHDVVDQFVHLLVIQRRQIDPPHIAIDADHRRQTGRQVQVGSALFGAEGQQFSDIHSAPQFQ